LLLIFTKLKFFSGYEKQPATTSQNNLMDTLHIGTNVLGLVPTLPPAKEKLEYQVLQA
jgi:hypothetical protein